MSADGTDEAAPGRGLLLSPGALDEVLAKACDILLHLTADGQIKALRTGTAQRSVGGIEHWVGRNVREVLTEESIEKLERRLAKGLTVGRPLELNHRDETAFQFPVSYVLQPIGEDGDLLLIGRDLTPIAEVQQKLTRTQIALEQDREAQRDFDTRYRVLMRSSREAFMIISADSGRIVDLNEVAAKYLGGPREELIGGAIGREATCEDEEDEITAGLAAVSLSNTGETLRLKARRSRRQLSAGATMFRSGGERMLLCRFEPIDTLNGLTSNLSEALTAFYTESVDGMVVTSPDGVIVSCNESFLRLANIADQTQAVGRSLSEFLARGGVDMRILKDTLDKTGQLRSYSTRLRDYFEAELTIELSGTVVEMAGARSFIFVIRDTRRIDAKRHPQDYLSAEAAKDIVDLIGGVDLKDILADTTEVVERMCIEVAINMTQNNRAAAAELLGLSRQSFYVKLRKYGLINQKPD